MKVVRRLRYTRALRSRKGLWLIRLDKMDKKNNSDKDYDGDDKHSVTNDNPAQERADIKELRALKKTQATRKSIGHLYSKKTNLSDCQIKYMGHFGSVVHTI